MANKTEKCDLAYNNITIRSVDKSEAQCISELALRSKAHWGYSEEFMQQCRVELSIQPSILVTPHLSLKQRKSAMIQAIK